MLPVYTLMELANLKLTYHPQLPYTEDGNLAAANLAFPNGGQQKIKRQLKFSCTCD
jgi:hypothetical protein